MYIATSNRVIVRHHSYGAESAHFRPSQAKQTTRNRFSGKFTGFCKRAARSRAIDSRISVHSTADGPGASKARDNGSRKPPLSVSLQNLAHSHGSARFAPWSPPQCKSMRRGCFKTIGRTLPGQSPFRTWPDSQKLCLPPGGETQHNLRRSDPQLASIPARCTMPSVMSLPSDNEPASAWIAAVHHGTYNVYIWRDR